MDRSVLVALAAVGCSGGKTTASGTVAGYSLDVASAYWGGPFIVAVSREMECLDMAWVDDHYSQDEEPVGADVTGVEFTFLGGSVVEGIYDVAGEAVVTGTFLVEDGGTFTTYKARSGQLVVDEITGGDRVIGSYSLGFDEGSIEGDLDVPACVNLKG